MKKYRVMIENNIPNPPSEHEMKIALLLTRIMSSDVRIVRTMSYRTPDFIINGETWELKSPKGGSKKTIENNLRSARGQSKNIILDITRSKMSTNQAVARARYFLTKAGSCPKINRLVILGKSGQVIDVR